MPAVLRAAWHIVFMWALVDNFVGLRVFLAQELFERGDVKAHEATSAFPDNAVLEEAAFVLACVVAGDAHAIGYFRDPAGAGIEQKTEGENREFYSRF